MGEKGWGGEGSDLLLDVVQVLLFLCLGGEGSGVEFIGGGDLQAMGGLVRCDLLREETAALMGTADIHLVEETEAVTEERNAGGCVD